MSTLDFLFQARQVRKRLITYIASLRRLHQWRCLNVLGSWTTQVRLCCRVGSSKGGTTAHGATDLDQPDSHHVSGHYSSMSPVSSADTASPTINVTALIIQSMNCRYYARQQTNPLNPPIGLCLVQASLKHGSAPMCATSFCSLQLCHLNFL